MSFSSQTIFSKDDHNIVHPTVPSAMWFCHCLNRKWNQIWWTLWRLWPVFHGGEDTVSILSKALKWLKSLSPNYLGLTLLIIFNLSVSQAISRILYTKAKLICLPEIHLSGHLILVFAENGNPTWKPTDITEVWLIWNYHPLRPNWVARSLKMRHHMGREKTKEQQAADASTKKASRK